MNKYRLYSEFKNIEIYGNDPIDAVNRQKTFTQPPHQDGEKLYGDRLIANFIPTPDMVIKSAIEIEDTINSRRGDDEYIRVIAECVDGKIIGIDMKAIKNGRPTVGDVILPAITIPKELVDAMENKSKSLGLSMPDIRREAYKAFTK